MITSRQYTLSAAGPLACASGLYVGRIAISAFDWYRAGPEVFEAVVVALLRIKQMNDHGAVIEQNPVTVLIAFETEAAMAELLLEDVVDSVAHGPKLAVAGAGGDDEEVEGRSLLAHVEHQDILAAVVFSLLCSSQS